MLVQAPSDAASLLTGCRGQHVGYLQSRDVALVRGPEPPVVQLGRYAPLTPATPHHMADHRARVHWQHDGGAFIKRQYSRAHEWTFDGGATVAASASPSGVPLPYADPAGVDPEEAFVAAIASCHMLVFLFLAAGDGFEVRRYEDAAVGRMTPNEQGVLWVSAVELSPRVIYDDGAAPTPEQEADLHHRAHAGCYIANSVRTAITVHVPARPTAAVD